MWDERPSMAAATRDPNMEPPIIRTAREFVAACDHLRKLEEQMMTLQQEIEKTKHARQEARGQMMELIDGPAETKARSY